MKTKGIHSIATAGVLLAGPATMACVSYASTNHSDSTLIECSEGHRLTAGTPANELTYSLTVLASADPSVAHVTVRAAGVVVVDKDVDAYADGHSAQIFSDKRFMLRADSVYGCWRDVRLIAPLMDLGFGIRVDEIKFNGCNTATPNCRTN